MDPNETKLIDCLIIPRTTGPDAGHPLFEASKEHGVQCRLAGYAIIPRERYDALVAAEEDV